MFRELKRSSYCVVEFDLGFTVFINNQWEGFELQMNKGWVTLNMEGYNDEIYCGTGYELKYDTASKLILPERKDVPEEFKNAVRKISGSPTDSEALKYIIHNAEENDALTLWHLLVLNNVPKRKMVLSKLDELLLMDTLEETNEGTFVTKKIKMKIVDLIRSEMLIELN